MDKRLIALIKRLTGAQSKVRALLKGKKDDVTAGIRRAAAFLSLAKGELEDFRRQFKSSKRPRSKPKRKSPKSPK